MMSIGSCEEGIPQMALAGYDHISSLLQSNSANDANEAFELAVKAVSAQRESGGADLLDALSLLATAARQTGRGDVARDCYAELVRRHADADAFESQLRAAGGEIWLARMADDATAARRYFERARDRRARAEARWGPSGWSTLMGAELAAELATLALARDDEAAAGDELRRGLDAIAAAGDPGDWTAGSLIADVRTIARFLHGNGAGTTAFALLGRAAEHFGSPTGDDPLGAALAYDALGWLLQAENDEEQALSAFITGLRPFGSGPDDRDTELAIASLLHGAGLSADRLGDYALSADCYERCLEIRSRLLEPADYQVLLSRYNLAEVARYTGEDEFAAGEFRAVIDVLREHAGDDRERWLLRLALKNLAQALIRLERPGEAERTAQEAIGLGVAGDEMTVDLLAILGEARYHQDQSHGTADELSRLAESVGARRGTDSVPYCFARLAVARALPAAERAAAEAIQASVVAQLAGVTGTEAEQVGAYARFNLGTALWERGEIERAYDLFREVLPTAENFIAEHWRVRSALRTMEPGDYEAMSLALIRLVARHLTERDEARRTAFRVALSGKRRQAEALSGQHALILQGKTELWGLRALAAQLRSAAAWGAGDGPRTGAVADDLDTLARAENALARRVPREALLEVGRRSTAEAVAAALPEGTTLVEYVRCRGLRSRGRGVGVDEDVYLAFVLPAGQPERLVIAELGPVEPVDAAVQELRDAISQGVRPAADWRDKARRVAALIWDPVEDRLPGVADIFVAPDGGLCAVPFDALTAPDGRPLLETLTLIVIATGRDVQRMRTRANWRTRPPVVIAAPDFGEPWEPFGPLPGTVREGSAVADLLETDPVTDDEATRGLLLELDSPEILHLATHGYYVQPSVAGGLAARISTAAEGNPLLSSGVALAGANSLRAGELPGVASALDVLGMDLAGTDLVVLSACESGLGPLDAGEGLLGLARSFLLAGARSVVWSMWRIDDMESAALVEDMYRRILDRIPRARALRAAKLALHARLPQRPDLWASLVLQGDPGALLRYRSAEIPDEQIYVEEATRGNTAGWAEPADAGENVTMLDTRGRPFSVFDVDVGGDEPIRFASVDMSFFGSRDRNPYDAGQSELEAGNIDAARQYFEQAMRVLAEAVGGEASDPRYAARLHDRLGVVSGLSGDAVAARTHGLAALDLLQGVEGADSVRSVVLDNLGVAEFNLGDYAGGQSRLAEALRIKLSIVPPDDEQIAFTRRVLREMRDALDQETD
jgi:CHAT domain-containing protein